MSNSDEPFELWKGTAMEPVINEINQQRAAATPSAPMSAQPNNTPCYAPSYNNGFPQQRGIVYDDYAHQKRIDDLSYAYRQQVEVGAYIAKKNADVQAAYQMAQIKQQEALWKNSLKQNRKGSPIPTEDNDSDAVADSKSSDLQELFNRFVQEFHVFYVPRHKINIPKIYYSFSPDILSFQAQTEKDLRINFSAYILEHSKEAISPQKFNSFFPVFLNQIVEFDASGLRLLPQDQILFKNGLYDLATGNFQPDVHHEEYFAPYIVDFDFSPTKKRPTYFERYLTAIFGDNEDSKTLLYEIFGAVLSNHPSKSIFLFQGVTDGGKSRLARILCRLVGKKRHLDLDDVNELGTMDASDQPLATKLIWIDELPRRMLSSNQEKKLKKFGNHNDDLKAINVRLLVNSNYKIFTREDGTLAPALKSRFVPLLFPRKMNVDDDDVCEYEDRHFEDEKNEIFNASLEAFRKVVERKDKFTYVGEVNTCLDVPEDAASSIPISPVTPEEVQRIHERVSSTVDIQELCQSLFEITEDESQYLSLPQIQGLLQARVGKEIDSRALGRKLNAAFGNVVDPVRPTDADGKKISRYHLKLKSSVVPPAQGE